MFRMRLWLCDSLGDGLQVDYYKEGQGSLMQCVLTPADSYMPLPNEAICAKVDAQVQIETFSTS